MTRLLVPNAEQRAEAVAFLHQLVICALLPLECKRALTSVRRVVAGELAHLARLGFERDDPRHRPVEERAVV